MMKDKARLGSSVPATSPAAAAVPVPVLIERAGRAAADRFIQFLIGEHRNRNTREAYARDLRDFFIWAERRGTYDVREVSPKDVATYIELLGKPPPGSRNASLYRGFKESTIKRHLAAIRKLLDWLVAGHVIDTNPAWSVRGPKLDIREGLTPELSPEEVRRLLAVIPRNTLIGIRDRALIAGLLYSWARASAFCRMRVQDYALEKGKRVFRLHEKGNKFHRVTVHRAARKAVEQYIMSAKLAQRLTEPLFQTIGRSGKLTGRSMTRNDAYKVVRKWARKAGLPPRICCHSTRATAITEFIRKGGSLITAARIANHASVKTTQRYVHVDDDIEQSEIERVDY